MEVQIEHIEQMGERELIAFLLGRGVEFNPSDSESRLRLMAAQSLGIKPKGAADPSPKEDPKWLKNLKGIKVDWTDVSLVGAAFFLTILALPLGFLSLIATMAISWHIVRSIQERELVWDEIGRYAWFKALSLAASIFAAVLLFVHFVGWAAGENLGFILFIALASLGFDLYTEWRDEQLKVQPIKSETEKAEENSDIGA